MRRFYIGSKFCNLLYSLMGAFAVKYKVSGFQKHRNKSAYFKFCNLLYILMGAFGVKYKVSGFQRLGNKL